MVGLTVKLLAYIREALGSYLGWETGYTAWGFSFFSSVLLGQFRNNTYFD
jgi:hypothetical protein